MSTITSDAPDACPGCGKDWSAGEHVKTDDPAAHEGYEDWRYCAACGCELFYPHKLETQQ